MSMIISRKRLVLFLLLFTYGSISMAQEMAIANISNTSGYYDSKIEISGSGFGSSISNLEVWFGGVKGTLETASSNLLVAKVPLGATHSTIMVRNKSNGISATSSQIFYPIFQGVESPDFTSLDRYSFTNSQELADVTIVDLDGDGKNDILASKIDDAANSVVAYLNTSTGQTISFTESNIPIGSPTFRVDYGDLDGDGKQDIVLSREGNTKSQIYILRNTSTPGNISFASVINRSLANNNQAAKKVVIEDLDLDGKPEIIVANSFDGEINIFKNNSTLGNLNIANTPVTFNAGNDNSNDIVVEDFDKDGKHDIAVTEFGTSDVYILPNSSSSGTLQFQSPVTVNVNGNLNNIAAGDINDDGKIDLVVTDPLSNNIFTVINESSASSIQFADGVSLAAGAGSFGLALADINGNSKPDILVTSTSGTSFTIFENNSSDGTLSLNRSDVTQTGRSINIAIGDLNNDTKPDIALTGLNSIGTEFFLVVARNNFCIDPVLLGDANPTICNGQTYRFMTAAATEVTYTWLIDGTPQAGSNNPYFDATVSGDYSVQISGEAGACVLTSATTTLGSNSGSIPVDPIASNDGPACIDGSISLNATDIGDASAIYSWTGPNGFTSTEQNPVLTGVTAIMAGTYYVKAIVSPCESNVSSTIVEVVSPPDLSVSKDIEGKLCEGETITLTVGASSDYTYQWFKDNTVITGANSNSYGATETGSYTVNLKGISNNCDRTSEPVAVEMFSPPVPSFSTSGVLCEESVITFTESTTLEPGKTPTFAWDFGDGNTSTERNPTHTYAVQPAATDYTVQLVVGYVENNCDSEPETNVLTISKPTAFTIDINGLLPFCEGDSVELSVPSTGLTSVTWSNGQTGFSIYAKEAGTVIATAINTTGCESIDQVELSTISGPNVTAIAAEEEISLGSSVQLEASGASTYMWSPPETLDDPTSATPIATPIETTIYMVTGIGANNCSGSAELTIIVTDTGDELPITTPKMFSPNNDGINDLWEIDNIQNFPDCELVIFARNGEIVFQSRGYNNDWNGMNASNNELPEGAYFFTISCPDGKNASGSVSIIR